LRITRRDLLKLGAWAAASGLIPSTVLAQGRQSEVVVPINPKRVLIIGAGLSGLVAAYELRKLGHEVTILEAQRRAGGRVYSIHDPFSDGLYSGVGASRIPDNHDLTLRYVNEFNLPLTPFYPTTGSRLYSIGGKRIRTDVNGEWLAREAPLALKSSEKKLGSGGCC
jgi:monoamine oxidase